MSRYDRSIRVAFDRLSAEIIDASQVFDDKKDAFSVRRQFHRNEVELYCCECDQKLNVSSSKFQRLHFKHEPFHKACVLTDNKLALRDLEVFYQAAFAKESERHRFLKNAIAKSLQGTEGIDPASIAVDNRFIYFGDEKRRPDVYCIYKGKQIVFEIQLSNLSLRYILSRHEFYKKAGIYLIWILDNFNVQGQSQMELDIKYLTSYENFFKFNEAGPDFLLHCQYKVPYIANTAAVHTKWMNRNVSLDELSFDSDRFEAYYFDFGKERALKDEELRKLKAEQQAQETALKQQERLNAASIKARGITTKIAQEKSSGYMGFWHSTEMISELDEYEVEILNKVLNLRKTGPEERPAINKWLKEARRGDDYGFLNFIMKTEAIRFQVNETDKNGITALQELFANMELQSKLHVASGLFKRGYKLTIEDKEMVVRLFPDHASYEPVMIELFDRATDRSFVTNIIRNPQIFCILETAWKKRIVGFKYKPDQWSAFAVNAIQYYKRYWVYIELAFKQYGIWQTIIDADWKNNFSRKLQALIEDFPQQDYELDAVITDLYPELLDA